MGARVVAEFFNKLAIQFTYGNRTIFLPCLTLFLPVHCAVYRNFGAWGQVPISIFFDFF